MRLGGWSLIRVRGESMAPLLPSDSFCLFRRASGLDRGDIVLVRHPRLGSIVKLIQRIDGKKIWLEGVSQQSTSTASLGAVSAGEILGRLVLKIAPPERSIYG